MREMSENMHLVRVTAGARVTDGAARGSGVFLMVSLTVSTLRRLSNCCNMLSKCGSIIADMLSNVAILLMQCVL